MTLGGIPHKVPTGVHVLTIRTCWADQNLMHLLSYRHISRYAQNTNRLSETRSKRRTVQQNRLAALARVHKSKTSTVRQKRHAKCVPSDRNSAQEDHRKHKVRTVHRKCDRKQGPSDKKEAMYSAEPGQHRFSGNPVGPSPSAFKFML